MRFSRNTVSGEMEVYTDDGIYVGHVFAVGDLTGTKKNAQDGGPGSGNFGHAGNPPHVGGSAPSDKGGYAKKMKEERARVLSLPKNEQAIFLSHEEVIDQDELLEAFRFGDVSKLVNDYFDIMEENGDPTPTKPERESPDMWEEIKKPCGDPPRTGDWDGTRKRIMEEYTGLKGEELERAFTQLGTWFSGMWSHADTKVIDDYIDRDGVQPGTIYRGMKFTQEGYEEFMKGLERGSTMKGSGMNSSWTTSEEMAYNFAKGERRVIVKCVKNKTAAPVDFISGQGEGEVVAHSKSQWTVMDVQEGSRVTIITVVEKEQRMSDEDRAKLREKHGLKALDGTSKASLSKRMEEQQKYFVVDPPEEILKIKLSAQDGGPGSGNYGHAGRPGKVGGSMPGGGSHYRGGRADIGYFSSRKDWLNGLSGERQHEASKFLAREKKNLEESLKIKNALIEKAKKQGKSDEWIQKGLKQGHYDRIDENTTPEEYVMKHAALSHRKELLDHVGEARSWKDKALILQAQNLTNQERMNLDMLVLDYNRSHLEEENEENELTREEVRNNNLDRVFNNLTPEQQELYLDLKAKACGLPTSGKGIEEYSDELLISLGIKEPPKPRKLPTTDKENKEWIEVLDPKSDESHAIQEEADKFMTSIYNWSGNGNMNEVEQRMIDVCERKAEDGLADPYIQSFARVLSLKDKILNGEYYKKVKASMDSLGELSVGNLDRIHARPIRVLFQHLERKQENKIDTGTAGDVLETGFLMDKSVPQEVKNAYLTLKAYALGTPVSGLKIRECGGIVTSYVRDENDRERERKAKEAKEQKQKTYNEARKSNAVVVQGDSFSEKVNSMRKESGEYTEDEIRSIGKEVSSELSNAVKIAKAKKAELDKKRDELYEMIKIERQEGESWHDYYERTRPLREERQKRLAELQKEYDAVSKPVIDVLKRVRKIGPSDPKEVDHHLPGRSSVKKAVRSAYDDYPTEWIEMSIKHGEITTKKTSRGHYNHWLGEIAISGSDEKGQLETATHELGHRFEAIIPGMAQAERAFYDRRTKGEKTEKLSDVTGNKGYRKNEVTKKDKFVNPYIGKVYDDDTFEVVSMGFEYAVHEPERLLSDPDYAEFILGLMAVG